MLNASVARGLKDAPLQAAVRQTLTQVATREHIGQIVNLVNSVHAENGSVLPVTEKEVRGWVERGHSAIALSHGQVVGHVSLDTTICPGAAEIRACVVDPKYRGKNMHFDLTKMLIEGALKTMPEVTSFYALKNDASNGTGTFVKLGFVKILPEETPPSFLSIGGDQKWQTWRLYARDYNPLVAAVEIRA